MQLVKRQKHGHIYPIPIRLTFASSTDPLQLGKKVTARHYLIHLHKTLTYFALRAPKLRSLFASFR